MDEKAVAWLRGQLAGDAAHWQRRVADYRRKHAMAFPGAPIAVPVGEAADAFDRVADCEAKLAIIAKYERQAERQGLNAEDEQLAWTLADVVGLLASAYRHRDGYALYWPAGG